MLEYESDIVIVGGGPAGSAAALTFLTHSAHSVAVIEQSDFQVLRIGEHVSRSIFDLLTYLQLDRNGFPKETFVPSLTHTTGWGSQEKLVRDSIFSTDNGTLQLNRQKFDLHLIESVADRGGLVLPRTVCRETTWEDDHWKVTVEHPDEGKVQFRAKILMDATGRKAVISRRLKSNLHATDQLVGIGMHFYTEGKHPVNQLIESVNDGWWYFAQLNNAMAVAVFFTDAESVSVNNWNKIEGLETLINQTTIVKSRLLHATPTAQQPWVRSACSHLNNFRKIPAFLPVGDAAAAFDPLSSLGIGFALSSGCNAARAAHDFLHKGVTDAMDQYQTDLQNQFRVFLQTQQKLYLNENRWQEAPFWQRRHMAKNSSSALPV